MTKKMVQNIILLVLISGGLFYAAYSFLISPLNAKYATARDTLIKTQTTLAEMRQRAIELPRLTAEMKVLQTQVSDLEKLLPKEKQIPQLLRAITKSAQQYQLKITQITPQPIVAKANYSELPFQLSVQGNFHTLALFLTDLGQGSRLMSARNVVFSQPQQAKDASVSLSATFTLVAYTFKG